MGSVGAAEIVNEALDILARGARVIRDGDNLRNLRKMGTKGMSRRWASTFHYRQ